MEQLRMDFDFDSGSEAHRAEPVIGAQPTEPVSEASQRAEPVKASERAEPLEPVSAKKLDKTEDPETNSTKENVASTPKILSVSDVNKSVKATLETGYRLLWIKGEISNFKPHSSGHFYFSLKDSKAQISAVMFRGFNQSLRFKPQDGLEVIVRGKITVYEPRGSYQIFCELMEPVGAGALQLAFDQLKKKLELEGLFAKEKKRPLPTLPRHVAVVTSPTGAAVRDVLNILNRRFKALKVTVVPAVVQGDSAPQSICKALALAQQLPDIDVMIVGRGGGSIEDLWAFNDERVARAIAACRVPIISAVGHEIDFTIADFVADLRAPTPSAAAELVSRNASELIETVSKIRDRLLRAMRHSFQLKSQSVLSASRRLVDPKRRLQDLNLRCDELAQRLEQAIKRSLENKKQRVEILFTRLPSPKEILLRLYQQVKMLDGQMRLQVERLIEHKKSKWMRLTSLLDAVSPLRVVERGYSLTRLYTKNKDGRVIKSAEDLKAGDQVEITFAKGQAIARVEETKL